MLTAPIVPRGTPELAEVESVEAVRGPGPAKRGIAHLVCGRVSKWVVLVLWLVLLAVAGPLAGKLTGAEKNDATAWLPGSAESTKVVRLEKKFMPETAPAVVVWTRPGGLTAADQADIKQRSQRIKGLTAHGVFGSQSTGPIFDRTTDPRAAQLIVPIDANGKNGWQGIADAVTDIRGAAGVGKGGSGGLAAHITGPGGYAYDDNNAFKGIDGTLLYAAGAVVIVILLLTYRSITLIWLPLISVIAALGTAEGMVYLLAKHGGLTVNAQSAGILLVLVFGAGTDYALLLVARYREELRRHEDRHEAMALALHRAGPAILASAATVAVSMLCLLAARMNSTRGLGPVTAVGVITALLAMITLFPALLVIVGRWVFWPAIPHNGSEEPTRTGLWARIGRRIDRRPRAVWVTTAVILACCAGGLATLNAVGLSSAQSFTGRPDSVVGQDVQDRYFPSGSGQPLVVIANAGAAAQVKAKLATLSGVVPASVGTPPHVPAERDGKVLIEATTRSAPDSQAAKDTVDDARRALHAVPGADAKVGGGTATVLDTNRAASRDSKVLIPIILVVVLVILGLLLRALVAPLVLIGTVVLSFAAALGVSAVLFRHVLGWHGEDSAFPLFAFVFLVALGIDYNIFLMTRIREESARHGTREGALTGLAATGGVITSAGLVLAGTFAALATLPVVGFAEIGIAVAFGVLLDTFVVRSVLVTALTLDLRRRIWWPSRLDPAEPPAGPGGATEAGAVTASPR
jgi:RND superfamily putative drug exporter